LYMRVRGMKSTQIPHLCRSGIVQVGVECSRVACPYFANSFLATVLFLLFHLTARFNPWENI
jgi:hypothetical protein